MNAKKQEKRLNKGYKVKDSFYKKAKKRADKEGGTLANILENVVIAYSFGMDIRAVKTKANGAIAIDVFSTNFSEDLSSFK
jgi:hypothetical protein